jgi:acyl-CoA dehydrogenase
VTPTPSPSIADVDGTPHVAFLSGGYTIAERTQRRPPRTAQHPASIDAVPDAVAPSPIFRARPPRRRRRHRALMVAGALERITAMTTQYALDRTQFSPPVGRFQAVPHQPSATLAARNRRRPRRRRHRRRIPPPPSTSSAIAAAKARAAEAAGIGAASRPPDPHRRHRLHLRTPPSTSTPNASTPGATNTAAKPAEWNERLGRHLAAAGAERPLAHP